jgi:IS30 family transposase
LRISHKGIYQCIFADKCGGEKLWQHLPCQKPRRKRYFSRQERRGAIKNRVGIYERPEIVDQKTRIGDWEGGTIIGKNHRGALVTLAERKSRYVLATTMPSKHARA